MSSERRIVRPFANIDAFEQLLSNARLRLGNQLVHDEESMMILSNSLRYDVPMIELCPGSSLDGLEDEFDVACDKADLEPADIELMVVVSTPYLRLADVVYREPLDQWKNIQESIDLQRTERSARAFDTPTGGVDILVAICLSRDLEPKRLRPHRKGTWLSRARFRLRTELGDFGLTLATLDDEERNRLGLGPDCWKFVELSDPTAMLDSNLNDVVTVYVDEQTLASISKAPNTPPARLLQMQLFLDTVSKIIIACSQWPELDEISVDELDGTVLGQLVAIATHSAGDDEPDRDALSRSLSLLRTDPGRFLSRLEERAGSTSVARRAVEGINE